LAIENLQFAIAEAPRRGAARFGWQGRARLHCCPVNAGLSGWKALGCNQIPTPHRVIDMEAERGFFRIHNLDHLMC
jgi:hypothetical protein